MPVPLTSQAVGRVVAEGERLDLVVARRAHLAWPFADFRIDAVRVAAPRVAIAKGEAHAPPATPVRLALLELRERPLSGTEAQRRWGRSAP